MGNSYVPRGDNVLVRAVKADVSVGGVLLTGQSGVSFYVEAFGPEVRGLSKGDRVALIGSEDGRPALHLLPENLGEKELFIVKDDTVALVVRPEGDNAIAEEPHVSERQ